MPTAKPIPNKSGSTITDEHLTKYNAIMGTTVKSNATPAVITPPAQVDKNSASIASLLASIPKAKGIGNKMFIFTGKKKIIMDGTQKEVEKIKTVDATPIKENVKIEEKPKKILSEEELVAKNVTTVVVENKEKISTAHNEPKNIPENDPENSREIKPLTALVNKQVPVPIFSVKPKPDVLQKPVPPAHHSLNKGESILKGSSVSKKRKLFIVLISVLFAIFIIIWTLFWLSFFGFIKLF